MVKLKNGVCQCEVLENGIIIPGRSLKLYCKGAIDRDRLVNETIPDIKDHLNRGWYGKFPILIYSYYSISNLDLNEVIKKKMKKLPPAKPKEGTRSYNWLITEDEKILKVDQLRIVNE